MELPAKYPRGNDMNGSHVAAASGITGNIAAIIVWISNAVGTGHWFPVDSATSIAIASVLVSAFGAGGVVAWKATGKPSTVEKP